MRLLVVSAAVNMLLLTQVLGTFRWATTTTKTLTWLQSDVVWTAGDRPPYRSPPLSPDPTLLCLFTSFNADERKSTVMD